MQFKEQAIPGVFLIDNFVARDERGTFIKTFHENLFKSMGFDALFRESYYSQSRKNVIRGMHFQAPPHDHEKLVYVTDGSIIDVILDLRKTSPSFKKFLVIPIQHFSQSVLIPRGCAHGFLTLSDSATVVYNVTTVYKLEADMGIRWDSFGYQWENVTEPILSHRDQCFLELIDFETPF